MTAPFCMMTRLPMRTRSRIETCACMTQSSPISAPRPIVTCGCTMVRAPIRAPSATDDEGANAGIGAIVAPGSTYARRCTPAGGRHSSANSATARANARYGSSARSTAHGASVTPGAAMTADACVFRSPASVLVVGEEGQVAGRRISSEATRVISMSPSPSKAQESRAARSRSFTSTPRFARRS